MARIQDKQKTLYTGKTAGEIVRDNILTYFNLIFAVLAALCILAGSFKSLTFLPVVLANIVIGIVQELKAKKVLDELTMLNAPVARVVRGSEIVRIRTEELKEGDIAVFTQGDQICADGIVESGEVYVNEALLTGESVEIRKTAGDSLLSGSFVVSGECRARLDRVGEDSYISQLTLKAKALSEGEESEMIRVLSRLVKIVGIIIIPVGLVMFAQQHFLAGRGISESIVSMVAALIGMIPEGLYFLTSVALAVSMIRLARSSVMLHDMKCIETLARVDVLCVDKTGTITGEEMRVSGVVSLGEENDALRIMIADYLAAMPEGNITDMALRAYFGEGSGAKASKTMPFSSRLKYSGALINGDAYLLGAPEFIMRERYEAVKQAVEPNSEKGFRVLLFARQKDAQSLEALFPEEGMPADQVQPMAEPLALILLENSVRENAPQTFCYFAEQDVIIKVISGDNPITVSRVALQAHIPGAENYIDARTLETPEQIAEAAEKYTVFGRVTPEQKLDLVKALKKAGHTVGMTGDGVNDVLALKEADCSVAMASGAGAAVQVSKMVLLNSDFAAMPHAVLEGRRVVNNIQRSASLFLVKNIFSLITALVSILFALQYPIIPSQMTLVAAFTIGVPGFFLALAPCKDRIKGDFMRNVLRRAIPAGITDAIAVIVFSRMAAGMGIPRSETATACTVMLAVVGTMILVYICLPLNLARSVLICGCVAGVIIASLVLSDIFEMYPLSWPAARLLIIMCAACIPVLHLLIKLTNKLMK